MAVHAESEYVTALLGQELRAAGRTDRAPRGYALTVLAWPVRSQRKGRVSDGIRTRDLQGHNLAL